MIHPSLSLTQILVGLLLLVAVGCAQNNLAHVQGRVTLDDQPITEGTIHFKPDNGPTKAGFIKDGLYEVKGVPLGKATVQISAPKAVAKVKAYNTPDSPVGEIFRDTIPEKYNTKSELIKELQPGQQTIDFPLMTR